MSTQPSDASDVPKDSALQVSVGLLSQALHGMATPVYIKDRHHRWLFANTACCELIGKLPAHVVNVPESAVLPAAIAHQFQQQDEAVFQGYSSPAVRLSLIDSQGVGHRLIRRSELSSDGRCMLCFLEETAEEPTFLAHGDSLSLWNVAQFRTLLARVPATIYRLCNYPGGDLRFTFVSPGAFETLGLTLDKLQSSPNVILNQLHPLDRPGFTKSLANAAQALASWHWEGRYYKPDGNLRWLQTVARPHALPDGTVVWNGLLMDITTRKQVEAATIEQAVMEQALADSEARFRTIIETIPGALFQLRVKAEAWEVDYISDRIQNIVGLSPNTIMENIHSLLERIHPLDRDRLNATIEVAVADGGPWQFEGRIITPEGNVRWWSSDAVPLEQPQEGVIFCGVILDITERKEAELALQQREGQHLAMLTAIPDLMFRLRRDGTLLGYVRPNKAVELLPETHIPVGQSIAQYLPESIAEHRLHMTQQALETGELLVDEQRLYVNGQLRYEEVRVVPSGPNEVLFIVRDISDRKHIEAALRQANEQLEKLSMTDSLTAIANRRSLDQYLQREWQRAIREKQPLSFILFDLDYFKRFNDTYGHQKGDDCLINVAHAVQMIIYRSSDLVARYGGEEFAVVLVNTNLEGAFKTAERIRQAIQALKIPHTSSNSSQYVTVSLGVSSIIPPNNGQPNLLIRQADEALYAAKQAGRNKCQSYRGLQLQNRNQQ